VHFYWESNQQSAIGIQPKQNLLGHALTRINTNRGFSPISQMQDVGNGIECDWKLNSLWFDGFWAKLRQPKK